MYNVLDATYEAKIREGEKRKADAVARRMLAKGKSVEEVCEFTELSGSEVRAIQAEITQKTESGS